MSACSQCGTVAKPGDKFCNVCGTPLPRSSAAPAAQGAPPPGYGGPAGYAPPPAGQYPPQQPPPAPAFAPGGPPLARCQMGHEIAPGASYCIQGHPIALDQMQFASDAYGGPPGGGFGQPPPQPMGGQGYGGQAGPPGPYAAAAAQAAFAATGYAPAPPYAPPAAPPFPPAAPAPYGGAPPAVAPPAYSHDTARDAAPPRALRGFLVAYGTNPSGDFWPLTGGRHVVGRFGTGDGIDISLQDPTISSRHATLTVDPASGAITLEDTGSTNGTFVNDEHIGFNGRRELRDGDRLRFGGFTTIVKVIGRV